MSNHNFFESFWIGGLPGRFITCESIRHKVTQRVFPYVSGLSPGRPRNSLFILSVTQRRSFSGELISGEGLKESSAQMERPKAMTVSREMTFTFVLRAS